MNMFIKYDFYYATRQISVAGYSYKFSVWNSVLFYKATKKFQKGCWGEKNKKGKKENKKKEKGEKKENGQQISSEELDLNN